MSWHCIDWISGIIVLLTAYHFSDSSGTVISQILPAFESLMHITASLKNAACFRQQVR